MALDVIKNINIDFYDKQYQMINAKQYDDRSRYISITCYNQGRPYNISSGKNSAYIRYKKADGNGVLNFCTINYKGEILVELTEQMLASSGVCYVDLIIIEKGKAVVNIDTGDIITIDGSPIVSSMAFCVYVQEASFDNSLVESSYEYDALNELLKKSEADYKEVIQLSKSYAIGDADNIRENENMDNSKYYSRLSKSYAVGDADYIRENEDVDNAKYYSEQSSKSSDAAKVSEDNALESEQKAKASEENAYASESAAKASEDNALASEQKAKASEDAAKASEENALASEQKALASEQNAKASENAAKASEENAKTSEDNAKTSEDNAKTSETKAYDYCETVKSILDGLNSGFIPMGTISFSELATSEKITGFTYNISDDFVTDETFKEGAGKTYTAGTNVYYTADNYWDCFGGSASPTASVDEVKEYLGI